MIDIGANLSNQRFDKDREQVIQSALDAGVLMIGVTGSDFQSNQAAVTLAQQYPDALFATSGCHPHHASEWNQAYLDQINQHAKLGLIRAVGECGLDYNRDFSPRPQQRLAFAKQLEIAVEHQLPVFLHQRDAHEDFVSILTEYEENLKAICVHCFTGSESELKHYIQQRYYVGITGWICDERRGKELQSIVKHIPDDRLLIETDAPYLTPRDIRPRPKSSRNEPKWLPHIAKAVANQRQQSATDIAQITSENARTFFELNYKVS
jgi:TatD DNase family protein